LSWLESQVIETHEKNDGSGIVIIDAKSNLSMSLDRLATVFLGLSAVTLLIALGPLILGLWPILLVAIVHLLIVGWCLRLAWRGNWARERLTVDSKDLAVEHYDLRNRSRTLWPVAWVRIVQEPGSMGDIRLFLQCRGHRQEIGAFLPVTERLELARILKQCLRPHSAWSAGNQEQVS
jgi:uncharacterized membrane protein